MSPAPLPRKAIIYEVGEPMPSALKVGRLELPREVKRELIALMKPDTKGYCWTTALTWSTIIAIIYAAARIQKPWMTAIAICVVATRQNLLALLMHEQAHWLGSRAKWMDYVSELF